MVRPQPDEARPRAVKADSKAEPEPRNRPPGSLKRALVTDRADLASRRMWGRAHTWEPGSREQEAPQVHEPNLAPPFPATSERKPIRIEPTRVPARSPKPVRLKPREAGLSMWSRHSRR